MDDQRAAFPRDDVFGFVEAERSEMSEGPKWSPAPLCIETLGCVFDHLQAVRIRNGAYRVHFGADTVIMDDADCLGARRDGRFDQFLINVERVRPDIYEYRNG